MRTPRVTTSGLLLVLANLVPLVGVLLLDWVLVDVLVLYWAENVLLGVLNVPKILLFLKHHVRRGQITGPPALVFVGMPIFFVLHYGLFTAAHGVAVVGLFAPGLGVLGPDAPAFDWTAPFRRTWPAIAVLALSHALSFTVNYLGRREYLDPARGGQILAPYRRIVVLHVTVIAGAVAVAFLRQPLLPLLVLVLLKTLLDLRAHGREHAAAHGPRGRRGRPGAPRAP